MALIQYNLTNAERQLADPIEVANNRFNIPDTDMGFESIGNRLLVQEDDFSTGYECETCGGKCKVPCTECNGSGQSPVVANARCSNCVGDGTVRCPDCEGKGALLVVPETSERRPSTGVVISVGPKCVEVAVGDHVLYSNFSGYVVDLATPDGSLVIRILHENEIFAKMWGKLNLRTLKNKTEIATFNG